MSEPRLPRREFIGLLGGAGAVTLPAMAWPRPARAQQAAVPVIGYLDGVSISAAGSATFRQGLGELGFVEGRNVQILYRAAQSVFDRLPDLAAELVRARVAGLRALRT